MFVFNPLFDSAGDSVFDLDCDSVFVCNFVVFFYFAIVLDFDFVFGV